MSTKTTLTYVRETEKAYALLDKLSDDGQGDGEVSAVLRALLSVLGSLDRQVVRLAWAAAEKSKAKRENALTTALMELDAADLSTAHLPMKPVRRYREAMGEG